MAFFDSPDKFECNLCGKISEEAYNYPKRVEPRDCIDPGCDGTATLKQDYRPQDHAHIRTDNSELSDQWYYDAELQGLTD